MATEKRTHLQVMENFTLICKGSGANQSPQAKQTFLHLLSFCHSCLTLCKKMMCRTWNYRGWLNTTITRSNSPVGQITPNEGKDKMGNKDSVARWLNIPQHTLNNNDKKNPSRTREWSIHPLPSYMPSSSHNHTHTLNELKKDRQ